MAVHEPQAPVSWRVTAEDADARLDVFLSRRQPGLTRSAAARVIEEGAVDVEGRKAKAGLPLHPGDRVTLRPPALKPARSEAQALPLPILFQDEHLAVVNKPAGMVTHPAPGHPGETLVNALLFHLDRLSGVGGELRPGIVHRLDKDTTGLLLVAKSDAAHQALSRAIHDRSVHRVYEALVWGRFPQAELEISARLGRDPKDRKRFAVVSAGGREASTLARVQRRFGHFTLLELHLRTGRTHQIRVHCRHLGTPLVGDRTYGKSGEASLLTRLHLPRPTRQLLHARRLEFVHPVTGRALKFEAPWPEDFAAFVRALEESRD